MFHAIINLMNHTENYVSKLDNESFASVLEIKSACEFHIHISEVYGKKILILTRSICSTAQNGQITNISSGRGITDCFVVNPSNWIAKETRMCIANHSVFEFAVLPFHEIRKISHNSNYIRFSEKCIHFSENNISRHYFQWYYAKKSILITYVLITTIVNKMGMSQYSLIPMISY